MPAVALVGAASSVMTGLAAVEAGSMLVGGLMIAGGVTAGLGTLTGDKTLTSMGSVLGLAGGVAGLASGSWSTAATDLAQSSAEQIPVDAATQAATSGAVPDVVTTPTPGDLGSGSWAPPNDPTTYQPLQGVASPANPLMAPPGNANLPAAPSLNQAPTAAAPAAGDLGAPTPVSNTPGGIAAPPAPEGLISKWFKPVGEFIKNKDNAELLKVGGGLVAAGMKAYSDQALLDQQYQKQLAYRRQMQESYTNSMRGVTLPSARS